MKLQEILEQFAPEAENLLLALHAVQNNNPNHYIPEDSIPTIAKYFNTTQSQIYGIISYYSMFSLKPRGRNIIRVCHSPICYGKGAEKNFGFLEKTLGIKENQTTADGLFTLEKCECLGRCGKAPSMMINEEVVVHTNEEKLRQIITEKKNNS